VPPDALALWALGLSLGASGGLAPGPLTALVVGETLRNGTRAGVAVACAPLLTDGPILVVTGLLLRRLDAQSPVLGVVSLLGAAFLAWLGWQTARAAPIDLDATPDPGAAGGSLRRAVGTNLLNPHPWVFWITLGTPTTLAALDQGVGVAAGFLGCFFVGLVGLKLLMAAALGRMRAFVASRAYGVVMGALGVGLVGFAAWLAWDGLARLGVVGSAAALG
jgi:threonine/homoserine/homoserine lactone efflux protein